MMMLHLLILSLDGALISVALLLLRAYRFSRWQYVCGAFLLAMALRAAVHVEEAWSLTPPLWAVLSTLGVSLSLGFGFWLLRDLLTAQELLTLETRPAYIEVDAFSVIQAWDTQAELIFGWTRQEALGQTLMQTIMPSHDWEAHRTGMTRVLANGNPAQPLPRDFAVNAQHKTGRAQPVSLTITAQVDTTGAWRFRGEVRRLGKL